MSSKIRELNMELLKIISMILIIIFHYIVNSSFQFNGLMINNVLIKSGCF